VCAVTEAAIEADVGAVLDEVACALRIDGGGP
jgi:hypothetical protein